MKSIIPVFLILLLVGFGVSWYILGPAKNVINQNSGTGKPISNIMPGIGNNSSATGTDRKELCASFIDTATGISFPSSDLYPIYKNILSNKEAQKDWLVFDMLINKTCEGASTDPQEFKLCQLYITADIGTIENDPSILSLDKGVLLSILKNSNECNSNADCEFDINLVKKLKNKDQISNLPSLSESRLIEWYAYKKLFPSLYDTNLSKLFLENCLKS